MSAQDDTVETLLRRQAVLADFGGFALWSDSLDEVLAEACRLVAHAMGTRRATVLEIEEGGRSVLVRAGVGWRPGVVGTVRLPLGERSSETYSIERGAPVISRDVREEARFEIPAFMREEGVLALANAPILLPGGRAFGLLQVDDTQPRGFDEADTEFLRTYCAILGPVIDRLLTLGALRSSDERFRLTVEAATDYAVFVTDDEDRITDWLPGAEAVFGWTADEARGQPASVLFTPEDRAAGAPEREVETARREGRAADVRWHLRRDGARVFIEGSVRALHDAGGRAAGFLKIGQDVTERRRAEAALRAGEERQAFLLRLADALRALSDPVAIQGEAARLLREHLGAGWCYYVEWDETGTVGFVATDSTRAGLPSMVGIHDVGDAPEFTGLLRAGRLLRVEDFATSSLFPPRVVERYTGIGILSVVGPSLVKDGRLIATLSLADTVPRVWSESEVVLVEDVTERTWAAVERARAEAALRASEERQRTLIEGIPQLVWRAVDHGHWTWSSPQWADVTGQPEPQSHGWGWLDAVHPGDREAARASWEVARRTQVFEADFRLLDARTAAWRWFQTRAIPVRSEAGAILEWLGTSTDVQDLREMKERQGVLVAELQHRTRNLMGVVLGVMRRTRQDSPDLAVFAEAFQSRVEALARVNGLLSRLQGAERITFDGLIRTELQGMGALNADGRGPRVVLEGPSGLRLRSSTVQTLALALHELATNASKYGALAQPGGHLAVRWRRTRLGAQAGLVVEWTETGILMPDAAQAPQGSGYGRELIEQALPYQLGAETTYELGPDGVRCTIALPLSSTEPAET